MMDLSPVGSTCTPCSNKGNKSTDLLIVYPSRIDHKLMDPRAVEIDLHTLVAKVIPKKKAE